MKKFIYITLMNGNHFTVAR